MKILFLARLYFPHVGGVEKHVREVSTRLVKRGHEVKIVTTGSLGFEIMDGIEVYRMTRDGKWSAWWWFIKNVRLIWWADIVHIHDVFHWYLPFRLLFPFKMVYVTFHGWEETYPIPIKNSILRKIWEKLAHGTICVGKFISKWYHTKPDFVIYGAA